MKAIDLYRSGVVERHKREVVEQAYARARLGKGRDHVAPNPRSIRTVAHP
jgi:hypothetical protein